MEDLLRQLSRTELFSGCPPEVLLRYVLPLRQVQEYQKGQFIIEPQQQLDRFAVILSGKVHILHIFPDGSYSLMSALTACDLLGTDLICTRTQLAPYHAIAASAVSLAYFPITLLTAPDSLPEAWRQEALMRLLTLVSMENMKKEYRLAILSRKGLRERILTYLTMQSARRQKATFDITFSREEMAAFLCVNRSALSHELSQMQREGLIQFRKNIFTVMPAAFRGE